MAWWLFAFACWSAIALGASLLIGGVCSRVHGTERDQEEPGADAYPSNATARAADPVGPRAGATA